MNYKKFVLTLSGCLLSFAMNASQTSASTSALSSSSSSMTHTAAETTLRKRHKVLQANLGSLGTLSLNSDQLQKVIMRSCDGALAPIFLGSAGLTCTAAGAFIMASSPAGGIVLLSLGAGYFVIAGFCGTGNRNTSSTRASKHSHKSE